MTDRRALFICGSLNQTTQLHAVARALPELRASFSPFYGQAWMEWAVRAGLAESTILGNKARQRCIDYLTSHGLQVDWYGRRGPYALVVTCTDVILPGNARDSALVVVQEGMTDPEFWLSRLIARLPWVPVWLAGTTLTGTRGRYDRLCVASEGYRELFIQRGAPAQKLRVTGIPNFDDCASFRRNAVPEHGYVLVCTSDLRETARRDDRRAFWLNVSRIAEGRPLHVRFHPNEEPQRARRELLEVCPDARVCETGRTEELIANCAVLITQYSSVAHVGLALGKQVHSYFDLDELRRLLPIQNGGASAANIAAVCRELMGPASTEAQRWAS